MFTYGRKEKRKTVNWGLSRKSRIHHFAKIGLCCCGLSIACVTSVAHAETYHIVISDRVFSPNIITARIDHPVRITIENRGTKTHNFILPAFYIYTPNLNASQSIAVGFTPDKAGKFVFFSDAGGTKEKGLSGEIDVK